MLVNDREEIGTLGRHLNPMLCGHRLISPKVVVDSACVTQTFSYLFERKSDSLRTFERRDTHYMASQHGPFKAKVYLTVVSGAISLERSVRLRLDLAEIGIPSAHFLKQRIHGSSPA